ncbi:MAG: TrmH family RNA methyltransferase [Solirubrobacteraceae bacterium]
MIASAQNERIKVVRSLHRRRSREKAGRFVAEGEDLLVAAEAAGWPALERLVAAGSGIPGTEVEPALLAAASSLGSGTRAIGVYGQRWSAPVGPLCVYLHGVGDPGNVGAVLRSALAFGVGSVALGPGCADPYGPKAVRASMGAVFAVALARARLDDLPGERIALVAREGEPLAGPVAGEVTLLVGAEREGLPPEALAAADRVAHIPIHSESLNAAMAATVALYELTRGARPLPRSLGPTGSGGVPRMAAP